MESDIDRHSEPIQVKQEPLSRENTPFHKSTSLPPAPQSRLSTPHLVEDLRPQTPVIDIPCSQETTSTAPLETPVKAKIEEDSIASPLLQDSPSNQTSSARRKKRKSRRGKGVQLETPVVPDVPPMRLTHANKHWFDIFQNKQSSASISTIAADHHPTIIKIEEQFNYVKEILSRSLGWIMLPLKWGVHWAAIYILPLAIAIAFLAVLVYLIFPRYIFSAIPTIFTATTSVLAFPARLLVTHTPDAWCTYVGLGCSRNDTEGEEVVRNATFATDLEVRNAFTVIHNLNYLNNSSNRLVLDSVIFFFAMLMKVNIHSVGDAALHLSNWTDRAYIARQFYNLASESRTLGKSVTKLEVKGKGVMDHILYLYEQLWIKLEGSWEGKYSAEEVANSRDRLLEEVERELKDLQEHVHVTGEIADKALDLAQRVGGEVLKQRGAIASQSAALQASHPWWKQNIPAAFNWDKLTSLQQRTLQEDLQLTAASLSVVDTVKRNLAEMSITLEAFHESVIHARTENRKRTYMGLSVEDLLKSLEENLKRSRREIDAW
jgi:hypothetical protein